MCVRRLIYSPIYFRLHDLLHIRNVCRFAWIILLCINKTRLPWLCMIFISHVIQVHRQVFRLPFFLPFFCHWLCYRPFAHQTCIPIDSRLLESVFVCVCAHTAQAKGNIKQSKWNRFTSIHTHTHAGISKNVMMKVKKPIKFLLLAIVTFFAWRTCTRTVVCFDFLLSFSYCSFGKSATERSNFFPPPCIARILLWNCFASAVWCEQTRMCVCNVVHSTLAFAFWSLRLEFKFICLPRAQMCVLCTSKFSFSYQRDDICVTMHCTHTCPPEQKVSFFLVVICKQLATMLKPHSLIFFMAAALFSFCLFFCVDIRWFCQYIEHFTR